MDKDNIQEDSKSKETKGDDDMLTFTEFLEQNREKIKKVVESNTTKNSQGKPVIPKNDSWRDEIEWDELYKCLKKNQLKLYLGLL